jgi:hypothetical protein
MTASVSIQRQTRDKGLKKKLKSSNSLNQILPQAMQTAAPIEGQWCVGMVEWDEATQTYSINSGAWSAKALVAASCLLQPRNGDSVACLKIAPDQVWIMSILSREEGGANVLHFAGDTQLKVSTGNLNFDAQAIAMRSAHFALDAKSAQLATDSADIVGRQFRITAGLLKVVGSTISTVMERIQQYSKSYTRNTDGTDQVTANHVRMEARQLMQLDAEHTLVSGENLVKARSAQIHFG